MIFDKEDFESFDPELWAAIHAEEIRQQQNIEINCFRKYCFKSSYGSTRFCFDK